MGFYDLQGFKGSKISETKDENGRCEASAFFYGLRGAARQC